jgi:MFS family permease
MTSISSGPARGVSVALARVDGRHLLKSPLFLVGLGVALLGTAVFVLGVLTDDATTWSNDAWTISVGFLLAAVFAMLAVNRASLRDHREHTGEQHGSLPTNQTLRLAGMFGAVLWPAIVSTLLLGVVVVFASTQVVVPVITIVHVLHNAALFLMLGAVGLALAAWVPSSFAAPVVAFALYFIHPGETPAAWQVIWPFATLGTAELAMWHIVYLLGLALLLLATAATRWERGRGQTIVFLGSAATVAASLTVLVIGVCSQAGPCLL